MGNIVINNRRYRCPEQWTELSWEQFRIVLACGQTPADRLSECSVRLLSLLFGLSEKQASRTDPEKRRLFARLYARKIREQTAQINFFDPDGLFRDPVAEYGSGKDSRLGKAKSEKRRQSPGKSLRALFRKNEKTESFRWRGRKFLYPRTETGFGGELLYFGNVSASELCQATDLFLAGKWEYAPLIVSMLCRRSGEKFDEAVAVKRARQMKKLPMRVVRRLFRLFMLAHAQLRSDYPSCYERTPTSRRGNDSGPAPRWCELLKWVARYAPSEIGPTGRMNCRDFLDIAQSRIETTK